MTTFRCYCNRKASSFQKNNSVSDILVSTLSRISHPHAVALRCHYTPRSCPSGACAFPAARSAYRDSFITLRTGAACIRPPSQPAPPMGVVEGVRSRARPRALSLSRVHVLIPRCTAVGVHSPWHPQNGRFTSASSIREFQMVRSTTRDLRSFRYSNYSVGRYMMRAPTTTDPP